MVGAAAQAGRQAVLERQPRGEHRAAHFQPGPEDQVRVARALLEADAPHLLGVQRVVHEAVVVARRVDLQEPIVGRQLRHVKVLDARHEAVAEVHGAKVLELVAMLAVAVAFVAVAVAVEQFC